MQITQVRLRVVVGNKRQLGLGEGTVKVPSVKGLPEKTVNTESLTDCHIYWGPTIQLLSSSNNPGFSLFNGS